ncbi:MAG: flagellar FliJ family protein [Deltaproteobacteria bacterium]|nr:flagellar FliJ family protein [Deltaproteobacteria bacterium]
MSARRLERIARLIRLRERARDEAQAKLAEARRATEAARDEVRRATQRWQDEVASADAETAVPMSEFALWRMHLQSLRREVECAATRLDSAERREADELATTTEAQRELRKMELWRESEADRMRTDALRGDQALSDEIAARIVLDRPRGV